MNPQETIDSEEKPRKSKKRIFLIFSLILFIGLIIFVVFLFENNSSSENEDLEKFCGVGKYTLAWFNLSNDELIGYGVVNQPENTSINLIDIFIEDKIVFVYSSKNSDSNKQIEIFGNRWKEYQKSGLTIDCKNE